MIGLLIYNKIDYKKNEDYVKWLKNISLKNNIDLKLIIKETYLVEGLPHFKEVDFVINRTRSYEISLIFEMNDIRVFNNSNITLLGNNKLAAYSFAKNKGYEYPSVLTSWANNKGIISKPNNEHGGTGIGLLEEINISDGFFRFQQEFINNLVGDIRFYIINNKVIHAVLRTSQDKIISNFTQGGNIQVYNYSESEREFVENFIDDLSIDYAGIDFLLTKTGKLIFNEIEDVVGSRMLSLLGINNTTDLFINHIIKTIKP
ncbi:ATP-grasp domain-containing protein [Clostridium sp. DL1XJH146]